MRIPLIIMNMMDLPHNFSLRDKLLVLRFSHLGRLPPAQYETEILKEHGIPPVIVEFGNVTKGAKFVDAPLCKIRFPAESATLFPKKLKGLVAFLEALSNVVTLVLRRSRPRLVVAHGLQEQVIARLLQILFRIPYVVHCHESLEPHEMTPFNRLLLKLERNSLRHAEFTLFPEATRQKIYRERYRLKHPSYTVFNCPRKLSIKGARDLRGELGLNASTFLLGYIGGIGEVNALDLVIDALSKFPQVHFLVWGWGHPPYIESLLERAKKIGVHHQLHFLGELDTDKWEVIRGLDASYCVYRPQVLRLKYAATASNKLFESMAAGIPVIVGNGDDFQEFLNQAPVGVALSRLTVDALTSTLEWCVSSRGELQKKGALGRTLFEERYHYEIQFRKALEAFAVFFPTPPCSFKETTISLG